jgi:antitoxin (DNA-binding transcriptional repressor) of toxin-antitoxin stability system
MFVLNSNIKGAIAEQAVVLAAVKLGVPVLKPVAEHGRCDLALDVAGKLWRVQCKWGRLSSAGDVVMAHTGTCSLSSTGYVRGTYAAHEIDLFAIYCGDLDRVFLVPAPLIVGRYQIHLRLAPARNGQRACINLADDFAFEGAIAQLGERCRGTAEVAGSSPASSTPSAGGPVTVGSNVFRDHLGYWMERVAAGEEALVTFRGRPRVRLSPRDGAPIPASNRSRHSNARATLLTGPPPGPPRAPPNDAIRGTTCRYG